MILFYYSDLPLSYLSICIVTAMAHLPLVLLLAALAAGANTSLRGAVRHVEDAIRHEMMIEPVRYSEPNISVKYQSNAEFDARGMANLYRVTNLFMDLIQREDPYPQGMYA